MPRPPKPLRLPFRALACASLVLVIAAGADAQEAAVAPDGESATEPAAAAEREPSPPEATPVGANPDASLPAANASPPPETTAPTAPDAAPGEPDSAPDVAAAPPPEAPPEAEVPEPVAAAPLELASDSDAIDAQLRELEDFLYGARFRTVISVARVARADIAAGPEDAARAQRLARLEVMTATAHVALGELDQARASFARAIAADPALDLDTATTSPKVLAVFDTARKAFEARP